MSGGAAAGALHSLTRFTDRVADYVRYRPDYPPELFAWMAETVGLGPRTIAADIGAGTGIFTRRLLQAGATVFAVEPNAAMRAAAEAELRGISRFVSVTGTGEETGLVEGTITLITAAQAFHWIDASAARREFRRISRPDAAWVLVWNTPLTDGPFAQEYERIKQLHGTDFAEVNQRGRATRERFDALFGAGQWQRRTFANAQVLDRAGLRGRMLSSSYAPRAGHPQHEPMIAALDRLFDRYQSGGAVRMEYVTEAIWSASAAA